MQHSIKKLFFLSAFYTGPIINGMQLTGDEVSSQLSDLEETPIASLSDDEQGQTSQKTNAAWTKEPADVFLEGDVPSRAVLLTNAQSDSPLSAEQVDQINLARGRSTTLSEFADNLDADDEAPTISTLIPDELIIKMGLTQEDIDEFCHTTKKENPQEYARLVTMAAKGGTITRSRKDTNVDVALTLFKLMHKKDLNLNKNLTTHLNEVQGQMSAMEAEVTMVKDSIKTTARQRNLTAAVGVLVAVIQFVIGHFLGPTCPSCDLSIVFTNMTRTL